MVSKGGENGDRVEKMVSKGGENGEDWRKW